MSILFKTSLLAAVVTLSCPLSSFGKDIPTVGKVLARKAAKLKHISETEYSPQRRWLIHQVTHNYRASANFVDEETAIKVAQEFRAKGYICTVRKELCCFVSGNEEVDVAYNLHVELPK